MNQKSPDTTDYRTLMSKALLQLKEAKARIAALERDRTEPVAIVGMGCRFPGGADNPEKFWDLLRSGIDAVTMAPSDRWNIDRYYDPDPDAPGKMNSRYGGFLHRVDSFDPQFFGISPREAVSLDPQQRLLLETAWEALEDACLSPERLYGSPAGVFVGISSFDYGMFLMEAGGLAAINAYYGTGNALSVAAGRIAYTLGLTGPCMAVDTACSSSLVAVHLACRSLQSRECGLAVAGGVNVILSPSVSINISKAGMLSPDGRCKTFDAGADGYARGEGCGLVVLKRLSDALNDGDAIHAVIRGSAVNQDGPSGGLTVPNGPAQEKVIRQALACGGVEPRQVSYVESHGTGTSLGDPIEVGALGSVFGKDRPADQPLVVGSVKTNIGHLESAAGIASLIKVTLALRHGEIPPHLHFKNPSPHIPWDTLPVAVPVRSMPWPRGEAKRIAGVSSFGFSGTNAHLIVEEAPETSVATDAGGETGEGRSASQPHHPYRHHRRQNHLLVLSAKTDRALEELAVRYAEHLATRPDLDLGDVCFSAAVGRSHFDRRLGIVADGTETVLERLQAFAAGAGDGEGDRDPAGVFRSKIPDTDAGGGAGIPGVAFLFTGQASQYEGMGRELFETQPVFRRSLERCGEVLRPWLERPLLDVLYGGPGDGPDGLLDETAYTQPAVFALEYALAELWKSWGVTPAAVMGHSVGEYAAACVAGVFSLEDGLKLIAARAALIQALPRNGEMAVASTGEERVREAIARSVSGLSGVASENGEVSIAAVNGPESTVISGEAHAARRVAGVLEAQGIKTTVLRVSHAFHSALMDPVLGPFSRVAEEVSYHAPHIPVISNVYGKQAGQEMTTSEYWRRHVREPVRFMSGMEALHGLGLRVFVEIGPRPVLLGMGRQCLPEDAGGVWLPSLRRGRPDSEQMLESLAELYVRGAPVDWAGFYGLNGENGKNSRGGRGRRKVSLPTYPFQRERFWAERIAPGFEAGAAAGSGAASAGDTAGTADTDIRSTESVHPLLGRRLWIAGAGVGEDRAGAASLTRFSSDPVRFESLVKADAPAFLEHHRVFGEAVMPAAAYLETALAAGMEVLELEPAERPALRDVTIRQALVLPEDGAVIVQTVLTPDVTDALDASGAAEGDSGWSFRIFSRVSGVSAGEPAWTLHASGRIVAEPATGDSDESGQSVEDIEPGDASTRSMDAEGFYALCRERGVDYGKSFRAVREIRSRGPWATGSIENGVAGCGERVAGCELRVEGSGPRKSGENSRRPRVSDGNARAGDSPAEPVEDDGPYLLHPVLLDACFQVAGAVVPDMVEGLAVIPVEVGGVRVCSSPVGTLTARARLKDSGESGGNVFTTDVRLFDETGALVADVDGLTFMRVGADAVRRGLRGSRDLGEHLYEIVWTEGRRNRKESIEAPDSANRTWLIFADRDGVGLRLASSLGEQGEPCAVVFPGERYDCEPGRDGGSRYRVNPERPEDFRLLLDAVADGFGSIPDGVVYLWSLDGAPAREESLNSPTCGGVLEDAPALGCGGVLHLVQGIAGAGRPGAPRLWVGTRGVHVVGTETGRRTNETRENAEPVSEVGSKPDERNGGPLCMPAPHASVWGLGRVIAQENPELRCVLLDLDPSPGADDLRNLLEELRLPDREDQLAFRNGVRYAPRLARYRSPVAGPSPDSFQGPGRGASRDALRQEALRADADGTYVVTGGFGSLGLLTAGLLVERGARNLVLIGRSGASSRSSHVRERIEEMERAGARVLALEADVSIWDDMERVFGMIAGSMPPLRGVVHAAGALDDGIALKQTWERFTRVTAPKVQGAWHLHCLTRELALDFFILFSSATSVLGASGQGNYAAANAFMDALAHFRRGLGLPALSINWGPWAGTGMGVVFSRGASRRRIAERGLEAVMPEEGLRILEALAVRSMSPINAGEGHEEAGRPAQVAVLPGDIEKFLERFPPGEEPPLFAELASEFARQARRPAVTVGALADGPARATTHGPGATGHETEGPNIHSLLQLRDGAPEERNLRLSGYARGIVAGVLKLDESRLDVRRPLNRMGLDSLMALELRNRLKRDLEVDVPIVSLLDGMSAAGLAEFLNVRLPATAPAAGTASAPSGGNGDFEEGEI